MPRRVTDAELLERIDRGQTDAFGQLYARHADRVYNVALRILGGAAQAADLTQEVFLTLHQRSSEIEQPDRIGGWLVRTAVNLSIDWWRKGRGDPISLEGVSYLVADRHESASPVDRAMTSELEASLSRAILQLSDTLREVVVLRYVEGSSYQEIAALLQIPIGTVKSRIYRAHEALVGYL